MWTKNIWMYKLGFEEAEKPVIKLPTFVGSWRKQGKSWKTSTSASLTRLKPLTVWMTTNHGKFLRKWEYQATLPISGETCMWFKNQQLELDKEQWTGSKLGKEFNKAVYCHPCLLNLDYITWNAGLDESQAGRNINNLRYEDDSTLMAKSEEELKSLLMRVKKESAKAGLKLNIQKRTRRGEESRWRRNRKGRSLSLLQIHRKNNRTVNKVYKTTSDR